jgi:8-hydroxy-5-deazaflavin:NADPH oxidoreductase
MAKIAVIGAGRIGGTLARKWSAAGHAITFGARDPQEPTLRAMAQEIGAETARTSDAVEASDVVAFAIPGGAMAETVSALGPLLDGKLVIDAANNVRGEVMHSARAIAKAAPGASYFRAFNSLGWELLDDPVVGGAQADEFFCGPEGDLRTSMEGLIGQVGLRPVWVGGPEAVDIVDGMLRLWFTLVGKQGRGRRLAFKMLED